MVSLGKGSWKLKNLRGDEDYPGGGPLSNNKHPYERHTEENRKAEEK